MKTCDDWHLLRFGTGKQINAALRKVQEAHARDPDASHIMELGAAYLWVREYETAWEHFRRAIERHPTSVTDFYGMAGAAKWCLNEFAEAVRHWRAGLKAEFSDTAGLGIHLPLLLFFASVLKPHVFERRLAEKLLTEKCVDSRVEIWPGPVGKWVLGQIKDIDLGRQCSVMDSVEAHDRHWLVEFYGATLQFETRKHSVFKETMRKLADTSQPEWSDDDFFLARMWSEEFFLARHEAS